RRRLFRSLSGVSELRSARDRVRPLQRDQGPEERHSLMTRCPEPERNRHRAFWRGIQYRPGGLAAAAEGEQSQAGRLSIGVDELGRREVARRGDPQDGLLVDDRATCRLLGKGWRHPPFRAGEKTPDQRETA